MQAVVNQTVRHMDMLPVYIAGRIPGRNNRRSSRANHQQPNLPAWVSLGGLLRVDPRLAEGSTPL